ncbi:threonine/serine exporter family protein [Paenibacillus sp. P96]|uniref:Threonine/serine exporter family protein n=1 Tax=Paenibacillus zeirhizosphaerae TaxID=2987519 RepID=A0ABT9FKU9_9BACL|nr:threonine/serine exporter family protein [Paenibacillus sp. P96]MDP4095319.1 threonine/serine exporter family protein [Paenibacillus sp. P96]
MLEQLVTSFIASAAFGILFHAPRRSLALCGFVGMLGWSVYFCTVDRWDTLLATFAATFMIGVFSQAFARLYKMPVIIFSVAGMIPLVPGGIAYDAMRSFVEHHYAGAIELAAQALMISGSIAVGLVASEVFNQMLQRVKRI